MTTIAMTVYDEDDCEQQITMPSRWEICGGCDGSGATSRHIEPVGGGFTGEEWSEMCAGDDDFARDYLSGAYDRPCRACSGTGKVKVPDPQTDEHKRIVADELEWAWEQEQEQRMRDRGIQF